MRGDLRTARAPAGAPASTVSTGTGPRGFRPRSSTRTVEEARRAPRPVMRPCGFGSRAEVPAPEPAPAPAPSPYDAADPETEPLTELPVVEVVEVVEVAVETDEYRVVALE